MSIRCWVVAPWVVAPVAVVAALVVGLTGVAAGPSAGSSADPVAAASACAAPEADQFDFWVGTWALTWGEAGRGTNRIRRILNGCVIEESFAGQMPDGPYRGLSVSTYDAGAGVWRQTWVDDQGAYLDFEGGLQPDGRMILSRTTTRDGETIHQRMVWRNVEADRLHWDWQMSTDGGATWTTKWSIAYVRSE